MCIIYVIFSACFTTKSHSARPATEPKRKKDPVPQTETETSHEAQLTIREVVLRFSDPGDGVQSSAAKPLGRVPAGSNAHT